MKKIILVLCASVLLISCTSSSEEAAPAVNGTVGVLLKKLNSTAFGYTITSNSTYDGNKILKVTRIDGTETRYEYSGNLITSVRDYSGTTLTESKDFTYTNEKLTKIIYSQFSIFNNTVTKLVLTHNTNNTINYNQFNVTGSTEMQIGTGKYTIANGNLAKDEYTYAAGSQTTLYTFDAKNSSVKNVSGFNKLVYDATIFSTNNLLTTNIVTISSPSGNQSVENTTTTYMYNSENYPTSSMSQTSMNGNPPSTSLNRSMVFFY